MSKVVDLMGYRAKKQKEWLQDHEKMLDTYISNWLNLKTELDFVHVANSFQALQGTYREESWDYLDLREIVHEIMDEFSSQLYSDLQKEQWFESRMLSQQKVTEYSLNIYIMNSLKLSS